MNDNRANRGRGRADRMPAHPDDERQRQRQPERASAPPPVKERDRPADTIGEDLDPGRFGLITKPTTDVDVARDQLVEAVKLGFNLLGVTAMRLDEIPPDHRLTIRLVRFPIADLDQALAAAMTCSGWATSTDRAARAASACQRVDVAVKTPTQDRRERCRCCSRPQEPPGVTQLAAVGRMDSLVAGRPNPCRRRGFDGPMPARAPWRRARCG